MKFLANDIAGLIKLLPKDIQEDIVEIRIKKDAPLIISTSFGQSFISYDGQLVHISEGQGIKVFTIDKCLWDKTLQMVTQGSLYAIERELAFGFVTLPGGFRVGMTGKAVYQNGSIKTQSNISSLVFRWPREIRNISNDLIQYIVESTKNSFKINNTLVLSPPGQGKTTLIRDIARKISYGSKRTGFVGALVAIVDERSEIAGLVDGVPQYDLGPRCDVLEGASKPEGIVMMIRSMNPQVIVTDEIGSEEDIDALMFASCSGVSIIATAHAKNFEEAKKKKSLLRLIETNTIEVIVTLGSSLGIGTVEEIFLVSKDRFLTNKAFKLSVR